MKNRKSRRNRMSRNGKRFLTARDMEIIQHDIQVRKSKIKRGEIVLPPGGYEYIAQCGCGAVGCMIHSHGFPAPIEATNG